METLSRQIKKGLKWQAFANVAEQVLAFFTGIVIARLLTPVQFGVFSMTEILYNFIFMFWNLGINVALVQKKEIRDEHLDVTFTICLVMGVLCYGIAFWGILPLANFFDEPELVPLGRVTCIAFVIYAMDRVPTALLDRHMKFKEKSLAGLITPIIYGSITIPMALAGFGPFAFAWGVVGRALGISLLKIVMSYRMFAWRPKISLDKVICRELLSFGVLISINNIINNFIRDLPRIFVGKFLGPEEVALLARSNNISKLLLNQAAASVSTVALSGFSQVQDDALRIKSWIQKFIFFTYTMLAPPMAFFVFFPEQTIIGIYGKQWESSALLLPWFAGVALISAPVMYFDVVLKAIGKPKLLLHINLLQLIVVAISIFFTVRINLTSVSIALFFCSFVILISNLILFHYLKIISFLDFMRAAVEPISCSMAAGFIAYCVHMLIPAQKKVFVDLIICIFVFFIIYSIYITYRMKNTYVAYLDFDVRQMLMERKAKNKP